MTEKFEIWCKSTNETETRMIQCKTIYQKWGEEDTSFKRRAKREFKKYSEKNAADHRKFYLLNDN